jgi:F0F1-type ATP synthase membrane subunit b/b'
LQTERTAAIQKAREQAEAQLGQAKARLDEEVAQLKQGLASESDALASQIANSILRRRVA